MNYKVLIFTLFLSNAIGNLYWVKYGWELFDYVSEAKTAALGQATSAYKYLSVSSSLSNPSFCLDEIKHISITHQSRFAGIVNSDLISLQLKKGKRLINVNLVYEGIGNIPDTRSALFDWGLDGEYGTNDQGENNGIIDPGERLDQNQIYYFSQKRIGIYGASIYRFNNFPIGIGIKILSNTLGDYYGLGIGLDLGINKNIKNTSFGLVLRNMPSSGLLWDNGNVEGTLPAIEMGVQHSFTFLNVNSLVINPMANLNLSMYNRHLDTQYYLGNLSFDMSFGIEGIYKEKIMLRLGQDSYKKLTGGIGLDWGKIILDYAFIPSSISGILANHHLISISFTIDWVLSKIIENRY
ncbi:MAG: hypothetical protein CMG55_08980 [Candidatus Marinimicrobia bacterium]|nr:hypothetical protein [Candidatus Neomarinimicrobiota bacterium]